MQRSKARTSTSRCQRAACDHARLRVHTVGAERHPPARERGRLVGGDAVELDVPSADPPNSFASTSRIGSTPSIEPSASQIAGVVNGERHRSRGVTIQNMHGATSRAQNASHRTTNVGSRPRADCVRTPKIQVMGEISAPSTRLVQPTTERDQATSSASTTTASSASTTTSAEPSTPTRRSARTARSTSDHRTPRSPHSPPADIAAVALRQAERRGRATLVLAQCVALKPAVRPATPRVRLPLTLCGWCRANVLFCSTRRFLGFARLGQSWGDVVSSAS
jgi:hypothetical protein